MGTRYLQAAISDEEHDRFTRFAGMNRLTLSELVGVAINYYIERKEEAISKEPVKEGSH
jgi:hypothetical protein